MTGRLLFAATAFAAVAIAAILGFLVWFSLPVFESGALRSTLAWNWRPLQGEFGILPMLAGSLGLSLSALALAFPMAVGLCGFAHGIGPACMARPLLATIRFMTGIPTVVYGLASMFLLVPLVREASHGSGFCWLAAALTLSLLVLPTIALLIDSQFRQARACIGLTAAALGFAPAQQLMRLTLPLSVRGLAMAASLGFGRAVGDTLLPLMLAGNAAQIPASPFESIRTLTAHIALVVSTDSQSAAYNSLFLAGLILFMTSVMVNLGLRQLRSTAHA